MKANNRLVSGITGLAAAGLALLPAPAFAQLDKLKLTVIQNSKGDLLAIVWTVVQKLLLFMGIAAFFYLLFAGFTYMTAGGDDSKVKAARNTIINVVIGIFIIAIAYVLVQFVISTTNSFNNGGNTLGSPLTNTGP